MDVKICDRCGQKIEKDKKFYTIEINDNQRRICQSNIIMKMDLCPTCSKLFDKYFINYEKEITTQIV